MTKPREWFRVLFPELFCLPAIHVRGLDGGGIFHIFLKENYAYISKKIHKNI